MTRWWVREDNFRFGVPVGRDSGCWHARRWHVTLAPVLERLRHLVLAGWQAAGAGPL